MTLCSIITFRQKSVDNFLDNWGGGDFTITRREIECDPSWRGKVMRNLSRMALVAAGCAALLVGWAMARPGNPTIAHESKCDDWACANPLAGGYWINCYPSGSSTAVDCDISGEQPPIHICVVPSTFDCYTVPPTSLVTCNGQYFDDMYQDYLPCTCKWTKCDYTGIPI